MSSELVLPRKRNGGAAGRQGQFIGLDIGTANADALFIGIDPVSPYPQDDC